MFSLVTELCFPITENSCLGKIILTALCGNEGGVGCRETVRNNCFSLVTGPALGGRDEGTVMFEGSTHKERQQVKWMSYWKRKRETENDFHIWVRGKRGRRWYRAGKFPSMGV